MYQNGRSGLGQTLVSVVASRSRRQRWFSDAVGIFSDRSSKPEAPGSCLCLRLVLSIPVADSGEAGALCTLLQVDPGVSVSREEKEGERALGRSVLDSAGALGRARPDSRAVPPWASVSTPVKWRRETFPAGPETLWVVILEL